MNVSPDMTLVRAATEQFYLAFVIWREARGESIDCRLAVGCSIMNRVQRPSWWGTTVDQVVTKKWQYSSLTDPHDPQLAKAWPRTDSLAWPECFEIARLILMDKVLNPVPGADSYYDVSIDAPSWTTAARFIGQVGKIRFYDVDHDYEVDH